MARRDDAGSPSEPGRKLEVMLITGRSIYQGTWKEGGKMGPDYEGEVSSCFLDREDARALGVRDGDPVRLTTQFGSLVLRARVLPEERPQKGIVFVPYGPYASMLVSHETQGTGMPDLKGLRATVEPAPGEEPLGLVELLRRFYGGKKPGGPLVAR